jgi:hypothetical protein
LSTNRLLRWAGLTTLLGSLCLMLFPIVHPNHDPDGYRSWIWIPAHLMPHIAAISFLFGLVAIFVKQGERNGWLGLAGYVLATLGTAQLLMVAWIELFIIPFLGLQLANLDDAPPPGVDVAAMIMNASLATGYLVLALGIIRARVLTGGAGILLAIAAPLFGLGDLVVHSLFPTATLDLFMASSTLFAIAMGWIGLSLWQGVGVRQTACSTEARRGLQASGALQARP